MADELPVISEKQFQQLLETKLGAYWERALLLFKNCGNNLSFDVTNVLFHAVEKNKVEKVLQIIEEHYKTHLHYQHAEIRGLVRDRLLGVNPTHRMFLNICEQTLGLKPNQS